MRSLGLILAVVFAVITSLDYGCSNVNSPYQNNPTPMPPLSLSEQKVESANNSFATTLFSQVAGQEQGKNFFISPLSVSMALAMTLNGASGQTYTDMQQTLRLTGMSNQQINQSYQNLIAMFSTLDPNVTFNIANSIWYRNTFSVLDSFLNVDSTYFDAKIAALNFNDPNSADVINNWVSQKTNGKIPSVVQSPLPGAAMMYLINALYFHGTWKYTFDYKNTKLGTFHLANGSTESDSMMIMTDTLNYYSDQYFQVVELPYGKGDYSMLVLLPNSTSATNPIPTLDQSEVNAITNGLKPADVTVTLPKFKLQYSTLLNSALSQMGMGNAFSSAADFTRINPAGGLYISYVLHKTYIDVNEVGTEAAAVTVVGVYTTVVGPEPQPYMFNVNRPFIFLIKENHDNTFMFMGAIAQPSVQLSN